MKKINVMHESIGNNNCIKSSCSNGLRAQFRGKCNIGYIFQLCACDFFVFMYVSKCVCVYDCVYVRMYVSMYICMYELMYVVCTYMYV